MPRLPPALFSAAKFYATAGVAAQRWLVLLPHAAARRSAAHVGASARHEDRRQRGKMVARVALWRRHHVRVTRAGAAAAGRHIRPHVHDNYREGEVAVAVASQRTGGIESSRTPECSRRARHNIRHCRAPRVKPKVRLREAGGGAVLAVMSRPARIRSWCSMSSRVFV